MPRFIQGGQRGRWSRGQGGCCTYGRTDWPAVAGASAAGPTPPSPPAVARCMPDRCRVRSVHPVHLISAPACTRHRPHENSPAADRLKSHRWRYACASSPEIPAPGATDGHQDPAEDSQAQVADQRIAPGRVNHLNVPARSSSRNALVSTFALKSALVQLRLPSRLASRRSPEPTAPTGTRGDSFQAVEPARGAGSWIVVILLLIHCQRRIATDDCELRTAVLGPRRLIATGGNR